MSTPTPIDALALADRLWGTTYTDFIDSQAAQCLRTQAARIAELEAALAQQVPEPQAEPNADMVSVVKEDANNYCRILTALGMEEEGDPVAAVQQLVARCDALEEAEFRAAQAGSAQQVPAVPAAPLPTPTDNVRANRPVEAEGRNGSG